MDETADQERDGSGGYKRSFRLLSFLKQSLSGFDRAENVFQHYLSEATEMPELRPGGPGRFAKDCPQPSRKGVLRRRRMARAKGSRSSGRCSGRSENGDVDASPADGGGSIASSLDACRRKMEMVTFADRVNGVWWLEDEQDREQLYAIPLSLAEKPRVLEICASQDSAILRGCRE